MKRIVFAIVVVASWSATRSLAVADVDVATQTVSAHAIGSGRLGSDDGPAADATFVEPVGLAIRPDGTVVVADAGAGRIRSVAPDGRVTTLAGSGSLGRSGLAAPGGFRDGPADQARFSRPVAVAIGPNGAVYVADAANHCIRRIERGIVDTFAGTCGTIGARNGPRRTATFAVPRGLAFGADGTLYVADWSNGIRTIAPSGDVETLTTPLYDPSHVTALAVAGEAGHEHVFATSAGTRTIEYHLDDRSVGFWSANPAEIGPTGAQGTVEGYRGTGEVTALAALPGASFVYTDSRRDAIAVINDRFSGLLIPAGVALQSPTGVTVEKNGSIVVASSGSRQLVVMDAPDLRSSNHPGVALAPNPAAYRIALLGNSYVAYNTWWNDSIAGRVEARLNASRAALQLPRPAELYPIRFGPFHGISDYVADVLLDGGTDAVVLDVNGALLYNSYHLPYWEDLSTDQSQWLDPFTKDLERIATSLASAHVPLVIVVQPMPNEVGPLERIGGYEEEGRELDFEAENGSEPALLTAVIKTVPHACVLDLAPAFAAGQKTVPPARLFETGDFHFSSAGRALAAEQLAATLERCRPWASP